jgi:hypothetical protein
MCTTTKVTAIRSALDVLGKQLQIVWNEYPTLSGRNTDAIVKIIGRVATVVRRSTVESVTRNVLVVTVHMRMNALTAVKTRL